MGFRCNLEELSGRVATVEVSPGLRRGLRRRAGTRGGVEKWGEVVGEGRFGLHLHLEVLPLKVVRMVLRLRLVLAGVLHFASCFFHFHGTSVPCFVVELARSTRPCRFGYGLPVPGTSLRELRSPEGAPLLLPGGEERGGHKRTANAETRKRKRKGKREKRELSSF